MQPLDEFLDKKLLTRFCTCEALGSASRSPKAPTYLLSAGWGALLEKSKPLIYCLDNPNLTC